MQDVYNTLETPPTPRLNCIYIDHLQCVWTPWLLVASISMQLSGQWDEACTWKCGEASTTGVSIGFVEWNQAQAFNSIVSTQRRKTGCWIQCYDAFLPTNLPRSHGIANATRSYHKALTDSIGDLLRLDDPLHDGLTNSHMSCHCCGRMLQSLRPQEVLWFLGEDVGLALGRAATFR